MDKHTGGRAFPCDNIVERNEKGQLRGHEISSAGMTLRDYFAAKVLEGEFACQSMDTFNQEKHFDNLAKRCYLMADAMLAAREQKACPRCHGTGDTGSGYLDCGDCDAAQLLAEEAKRRG